MAVKVSAEGLALIRRFEGLRLDAYPDPGSGGDPWTIGVGTTVYPDGRAVRRGDRITEAQAMQYLAHDLKKVEAVIAQTVTVKLTQSQVDALASFIYNVGEGAWRDSTLLRELNQGDTVSAEAEFGRWVKASGVTLEGLVRRREAEAKLFRRREESNPGTDADAASDLITPEKLQDFFRYYDHTNPNHRRAVWMLAGVIPAAALRESAEWVKTYRTPVPGVPRSESHQDMQAMISTNFRWGEAWLDDPERVTDDPAILANIHRLAEKLEWVRSVLQTPLVITSWYRPPHVNARTPGAEPNSIHLTGLAADVVPTGVPLRVLQDWALENWPGGVGVYDSFCHLDLGPKRSW